MSNFFNNPNPFATPVGILIEKSTDALSPDDNYELYFEICDLINVKDENAKDAMRAIRKKLSIYSGKNWSVVLKLLKLLETCSNNCNKNFQILLANKDLLQDLKTMIGPKLQPPMVVQEKVLYLIQHWATTFKHNPDFKTIEVFYTDLRTKGVDFPVYDPASMYTKTESSSGGAAAAHANALGPESDMAKASVINRNSSRPAQPVSPPQHQNQQPSRSGGAQYQRMSESQLSAAAIKLNEEQVAKLNSELDVVDCNVQVLNEILNNIQSSNASASAASSMNASSNDLDLLQELHKTCREMQKRITQLIGSITNENVIGELLRINDDLNNAFLRYERYERSINPNGRSDELSQRQADTSTAGSAFRMPQQASNSKPDEQPLIDFGTDSANLAGVSTDDIKITTNNMKNLNLNSNDNSKTVMSKSNSNDLDENDDMNAFLGDENEIKEIENWLQSSEGIKYSQNALSSSSATASATASSSETPSKPTANQDLLS